MPPRSLLQSSVADESDEKLQLDTEAQTKPLNVDLQQQQQQHDHYSHNLPVPPTVSLPLLNMIDMFAVSLIVPLLFQYYASAGVTLASSREVLSSLFSASQIIGGLVLGALADSSVMSRRTVLFISFLGSALAYALMVFGEFWALVCSRILVGLVKQTFTVATTMIARYTPKEDRATHIGRLKASSAAAWIVGPSVGAFLYKNVDKRAPPMLACALFVLNFFLAAVLLSNYEETRASKYEETGKDDEDNNSSTDSSSAVNKFSSFISNSRACFSSKSLGSIIVSVIIMTWVTSATSYRTMASFYEEYYGIEPHQRGYLSSYHQALTFIVQSALIGPIISLVGGEKRATVLSALLVATATWMELSASLRFYLVVLSPIFAVAISLMCSSLHALITHVAPKESLGSVFAALDVMKNAANVTVPFYRTLLFSLMGSSSEAIMKGDPNPRAWLVSGGLHWCFAALSMAYFLFNADARPKIERRKR